MEEQVMNENLSFAIEIIEGKKREYDNMKRNSLEFCAGVKEAINAQIQKCDTCLEYLKSINDTDTDMSISS
ncbi:MAG: hypothetical protein APR62_11285 [Smithella sp. SDB]|nr:MAG: hypothetical protein APR62_11285 [Smithella sp. SDB]